MKKSTVFKVLTYVNYLNFPVIICYVAGIGKGWNIMSFISKILDAFKLESSRKMENTIDNSVTFKEMPVVEMILDEAKPESINEETDNLSLT